MGRGNSERNRALGAYDNAAVEIPITLSTSPQELDNAHDGPFNVVVTAHNSGDRPITFWNHLTPLFSLRHGAFECEIDCLNSQSKKIIKIEPNRWVCRSWDGESLGTQGLLTIPSAGSLSVEHEIDKAAITAADVKPGERYRVQLTFQRQACLALPIYKLTDKIQGCRWWTYGTLDDLQGIRLRAWRPLPEFDDESGDEENDIDKERRRVYGDGPWTFGEEPGNLCFVGQNVAKFEVAGAVETSISALSLGDS